MDNSHIRVLLVEDDEDDYVITRDLLCGIEGKKFTLEWADTCEKAIDAIARHEHDVYLIDDCLGKRNGLEVLREALKSELQAPVIFLTGQRDYAVDIEIMKAGAADYLAKGQIDAPLLERAIRHAIERTQNLKALRESERRFRAIFNQTFQFIAVLKPDGTVMEANQTALEFCKLTHTDVVGRLFWECRWWNQDQATEEEISSSVALTPAQRQLQAAISRAAAGEFIRYEMDLPSGTDAMMTIDFSLKPVKDETGKVLLLIAEGRYITERKQAQEALQQLNEQLENQVQQRTAQLKQTNQQLLAEVAERQQTEKALKESEQRFRATFEQAAVGIAHVSPDGRFLRVNQRFGDIVEYTPEELLSKTFHEITHPEDLEQSLYNIRSLLAGQIQSFTSEKRCIGKNGSTIWGQVTVSLVRENHSEFIEQESIPTALGEPKYFITVIQDISARKEAETEQQRLAALLEQQARTLDEILSASPDLFYLFDRSGTYTYASLAGANTLGFQQTEIIGKTWPQLGLPAQKMEIFDAQRQAVFERGLTLRAEMRFPTFKGLRDLEYILSPIHGSDGSVESVVATVRDITDRVEAAAALAERESQLRAIFNGALDAILIADDAGRYLQANPAACKLFGLSQQELIGRCIADFTEHNVNFEQAWQLFLQQEQQTGEFRIVRADGSLRDVEFSATANILPGQHLSVLRDITERKHAAEALRESERRQAFLLRSVPVVLYSAHAFGSFRTTWVSENIERITGFPSHQFTDEPHLWGSRLHPNERQIARDSFAVLLEQGEITVEYRWQCADGSYRWFLDRMVLVSNESSELPEIIGVWIDITERKQAEEELKSSEELFRSLGACSPVGIFITDTEGRCTYTNPRCQAICGFTLEESLGTGWTNSIHPDDRERVFKDWSEFTREGWEYSDEFRFQTKEGITRFSHIRSSPLLSDRGQPIGYVGTVEDITERKQAVELLQNSEERFRQLAENIHQAIWMVSLDAKNMLYISPAYEKIWGRTCQSLYEEPRSWFDSIHPDDRAHILVAFNKRMAGELYINKEYRIVRPDGEIRWIWARTFPVRNQLGEVYRLAGIAEDISERKLVEAELLNALAKEKELSELKTRFVSMVSHEFRTPLSTIISSADLLEYYFQKWPSENNEKKFEHLVRIQTSVVNMTQLLEDVLFIGQTTAGRLPFNPISLELTQFCREVVQATQMGTVGKHTLVFLTQNEFIEAYLDPKLLRQLLSNLLSNAIKYSPQGGTIRFELFCQASEVIFKIKDEGIGIPAEDKLRLFEAFHRAQNVGTLPGTGLGLAVVRQCVDLHDGKVVVESELGAGATFTVTLPLKRLANSLVPLSVNNSSAS
ncbi:MAG: PAS domain S-box protein [Microcoleus vaginatus WJT46-NPBG5]|nr:PAS domain S-box protein [Microcoleus vaginatus WJT46-NPBG5]